MQAHKTPKNELKYLIKADMTRQKLNDFKTQKPKPTRPLKAELMGHFLSDNKNVLVVNFNMTKK